MFLQFISSSTGGREVRKHEGLSFAAVPIRVPCQRSFGCIRLLASRLTANTWLRLTSTTAIFQPTLAVHPLDHGRGVVERLFSAIGQSNRELFVGFHRSYSSSTDQRCASVPGFEPTGTKVGHTRAAWVGGRYAVCVPCRRLLSSPPGSRTPSN